MSDTSGSGWGTTPRRTARRIMREANTRRLQPGDRVASEPVLIEYFGVSRQPMRNALGLLTFLGAVEGRAGKTGGTRMAAPTADPVTSSLGMILQGAHADLATVYDALATIVPPIAARAAEHANPDTIDQVQQQLDTLDPTTDTESFARAVRRFDIAVGRASGNPALAAINEALTRITALEPLENPLAQRRTLRDEAHQLVQAITAHDADRAQAIASDSWQRRLRALETRHRTASRRAIEWPDVDELLDTNEATAQPGKRPTLEAGNGN